MMMTCGRAGERDTVFRRLQPDQDARRTH